MEGLIGKEVRARNLESGTRDSRYLLQLRFTRPINHGRRYKLGTPYCTMINFEYGVSSPEFPGWFTQLEGKYLADRNEIICHEGVSRNERSCNLIQWIQNCEIIRS